MQSYPGGVVGHWPVGQMPWAQQWAAHDPWEREEGQRAGRAGEGGPYWSVGEQCSALESPVAEVPQLSIWPELDDGFEFAQPSDCVAKGSVLSYDLVDLASTYDLSGDLSLDDLTFPSDIQADGSTDQLLSSAQPSIEPIISAPTSHGCLHRLLTFESKCLSPRTRFLSPNANFPPLNVEFENCISNRTSEVLFLDQFPSVCADFPVVSDEDCLDEELSVDGLMDALCSPVAEKTLDALLCSVPLLDDLEFSIQDPDGVRRILWELERDDAGFVKSPVFTAPDILSPVSQEDMNSVLNGGSVFGGFESSISSSGIISPVIQESNSSSISPIAGFVDSTIVITLPILLPISSDDVQSVLSDGSSYEFEPFENSPQADGIPSPTGTEFDSASVHSYDSSSYDSCLTPLGSDYLQSSLSSKAPSLSRSGSLSVRAGSQPMPDRRQKKKEQNVAAASRYRVKKRGEKGVVVTEVEQLEQRNAELKGRAAELMREIEYLRGLMEEIQRP